MSILQEIHAWSKGLAAWQQDAIARLYADRELTNSDFDDLYALAKAEAGIPDPEGRTPVKLDDAQVVAPADPTRLVQLVAVKDLSNVNALSNGGRLPIAPTGLTVIYGENGAGKSGYSRVFKHACRARDRREPILPNAKKAPGEAGTPSATFEAVIDGTGMDLAWTFGSPSPESLSEIAIFDTHCARAYIDNQGDFAYRPYGLDILEGLVAVCNALKARATTEKNANAPSSVSFAALANDQTTVAKALQGIPKSTKPEDIEALTLLSEAEVARLEFLTKTLAEADPKQKANALRQKATRFTELKDRIDTAVAIVDDANLADLRVLIDKSKTAKAAAELAATEFKQTAGQLPNTGSEEWKVLLEAARVFATLSHPGHDLSDLPTESQCPLCQNPLGDDGASRLARFDTFIKQAAETAAKAARKEAEIAYRAVQQANLDLLIGKALSDELSDADSALAAACSAMQQALTARQMTAVAAAGNKIAWEEIPVFGDDPRAAMSVLTNSLQEQAKALDAITDEMAKAAMIAEKQDLNARRLLGEVKAAVLEAIAKHEVCRKLQLCIDGMETRAISRKSTDLSRTMASQELADTLNEELKRLKVDELSVAMKSESPGGRTQFKLMLQLPGGGIPSAILSEGEQRAIAIASFLAELKLGKGRGGIVFDDPVSSLDHRRRWEVAERLAEESQGRQVIVFTHDIYFLCILEQKAQEVGATLVKNYIRRTADGYGVHSEEMPFDTLGTKDRISHLRNGLAAIRKAQSDGDDDLHRKLTAETYGLLRLAWERSIEEVLFNESIQRFGEGVSTQRLRLVTVTDEDYREINAGMTKSSKFEHDAAMRVGRLPIPVPQELSDDIDRLDTWRKAVIKRRDSVALNR